MAASSTSPATCLALTGSPDEPQRREQSSCGHRGTCCTLQLGLNASGTFCCCYWSPSQGTATVGEGEWVRHVRAPTPFTPAPVSGVSACAPSVVRLTVPRAMPGAALVLRPGAERPARGARAPLTTIRHNPAKASSSRSGAKRTPGSAVHPDRRLPHETWPLSVVRRLRVIPTRRLACIAALSSLITSAEDVRERRALLRAPGMGSPGGTPPARRRPLPARRPARTAVLLARLTRINTWRVFLVRKWQMLRPGVPDTSEITCLPCILKQEATPQLKSLKQKDCIEGYNARK